MSKFKTLIISFILSFICISTTFSYEPFKNRLSLSLEEMRWLDQHPVLTLAIDDTYPPLNFRNKKGKMEGLSVEYVNMIAQKLDIIIQFEGSIWPIALQKALDHKVDGIVNASPLANRKPFLNFTTPYTLLPQGLVTVKNTKKINLMNDLQGLKICAKKNTSHLDLIRQVTNIQIIEVDTLEEAFGKVLIGEAFGVFDDVSALGYLVQKYNFSELKMNWILYDKSIGSTGLGLRNDDLLMLSVINKAIDNISISEHKNIQSSWLMNPSTEIVQHYFNWSLAIKIFVPSIVIILTGIILFIFHTKRLNRVVAMKTAELKESSEAQIITEKALAQSRKMESIGTLSAGISHDFNNILFIIMSTAQLIMMDIEKTDKNHVYLSNIIKAGDRGASLIRQILSFCRQGVQELANIDIKPIIKETLKLSITTIPKNIKVINKIDNSQSYIVLADPTQIHQILLNLITNAYHAVELNDGEITVELKKVQLLNDTPVSKDLKPGHYAQLIVSDRGIGMDPEIANKIFDPYFTTKGNSKGTGLGLSVVYGIVKEYGGDINVYSELGKGAVFSVYLPLVEEDVKPTKIVDTNDEVIEGTGNVMLIDDEQQIVLVEKLYFTRHGYNADTFTSSIKALQTFKEDPYKYDIVITDMAMPELAGDKLCKKLLAIRPDLPIIMCSGFSERMNETTAAAMGIKHYLMKPVDISKLIQLTGKTLKETDKE